MTRARRCKGYSKAKQKSDYMPFPSMRLNIDIYFLAGTTEEFLIETTKVANPL